ncbi:MAG: glycosyltransferase family 9 protein [Candidatus Omnitrophica bacterium]|nr:glycosyltransferase family 9 protein [Candidatus Omnitrophota bacterium]
MKLIMMRRLDSWGGIPACFLLTLVRRILDFFGRFSPPKETPVKTILLVKLSEMGAIVLAYPVIMDLKKKYPGARVLFLTFSKNRSAFNLLNNAILPEDIYTIEEDSFVGLVFDTGRVLSALRKRKIDIALDLEFFSRFAAIILFFSGAKKRVGFYKYFFEGLYRGELLTHKVQFNPLIHCSVSYLSLGEAAQEPQKNSPEFQENIFTASNYPEFVSSPERRKAVVQKLKDLGVGDEELFLINPGEGVLAMREWPLENYIELTRRILKTPHRAVVVVGSNFTTGKDKALVSAVNHPRCISLVAQTKIHDLLELGCFARVCISNDCGLPHMLSLTPCPAVVLFGPETPVVFSPVGKNTHILYSHFPCSPCLSVLNHRESSCQNNRCLQVISVDDVFDAVRKITG